MSRPNDNCPEFSSLLLPFVDGEIESSDSHALLEHLQNCQDCTELVQEQQRVRALLTQIHQPQTPPNLLKRVHLALDEVDRQAASITATSEPASPSWRNRIAAMFRGGLVMAPAAAAAGLLWVSLRPEAPTPSTDDPAARYAANTPTHRVNSTTSPATPPSNLNANALPPSVPPPILGARGLPQDIEFVSAKPDVVHYRHARRNFQLIDRRQPGAAPKPNRARMYQADGQTYVLSRNAQGHAHLDFRLGHQSHRLTLVPEKASAQPGAISADHPHFVEMLRFARALQRAAQP